MSKFFCERLGKHHDRKSFDSGVAELDEYLQRRATQDMRRLAAAVFVLVPQAQPTRIAGFYTLSSASIVLDELPDELAKKLPRYPAVPAVLIGRLARDVNFPGTGKLLLLDALSRSIEHSSDVAAAVMLVDAKNEPAREFYARYGFVEISQSANRMFLPMKTAEQLLKAPP